MFGLFGLGAAKPKPIAPPKPAKPDPKVQQAQNKINADIKQISTFMATTPLTPEWSAYLQCLQRRLNDISIICNEPTTPLAKVRQMYNEAQAQAKKDVKAAATVVKKQEVAAVKAEKQAAQSAKVAARKAKKLSNGQTISIEPQEEAKVNALQNEITNTTKQIADVKAKIAAAKAARARGAKPKLSGLGYFGGLGDAIGGVQIDCAKKKNLTICAIAKLTQQTQDQMSGLIQILMDKQAELESLLAELSALVATTPTADDISAKIIEALPTPVTADEIGEAVGTKVTDAIVALTAPGGGAYPYDPTYQQPGYYQPQSGSYPPGTVLVDPYTGQPVNSMPQQFQQSGAQPLTDVFDFGAEGGQEIFPTQSQPPAQTYMPGSNSGVQFLDTSKTSEDGGAQPLPNMDDLLNDFGDEYYAKQDDSGFLQGLGCGENKKCGCGN